MKKLLSLSLVLFFSVFAFGQINQSSKLDWIDLQKEVKNPELSKVVTDWIFYCGDPNTSIGVNGAADFGCFIHIPTSLLTAHDGRQIQEMQVFLPQPDNISAIELRIYEEAGNGTPGTPVYSQSFTPNTDETEWTTVLLNTPYTIDGSQEVIIGYFFSVTAGFPAGCDGGPTNSDGDLMIWNGSWTHLVNLSSSLAYNWNIKAGIGDAVDNDAIMSSVTVNNIVVEGNIDITGTITNGGSNQITSFDLSWQIDGGTVHTETISGLSLDYSNSYNFSHTNLWNATVGAYNLTVSVSNINGAGDDDITTNNSIAKEILVATQSVQNMPLFEEFTSSTCPPCAGFNTNTMTPFMENHPIDIAVIKYQMSWPSPGDPYYTEEGGTRRSYYGVSSVPSLFTGGVGTGTNTSAVNNAYTTEMAKPAYFNISSTFEITGTNITVNVDIMPYITTNFNVQIAVVEQTTTENASSNGETKFEHVMMKMLPDANGTSVNFIAGTNSSLSETFDLASTNVEEIEDIAVVVFIQNNDTKEVFQSCFVLPSPYVTYNIEDEATNIDAFSDVILTFNQTMRLVNDSPITDLNISDFVHLTDPSKGVLPYTATINQELNQITITPDILFPESTEITVTIDDNEIENLQNQAMVGQVVTFTTAAYPNANVTFNPVDGATDIALTTNISLTFDNAMRKFDDSDITNGDISSIVTLTDPSKGSIAYTGTINSAKTIITLNPNEELPELTNITATIANNVIENFYGNALAENSTTFTTKQAVNITNIFAGINIYPNPAKSAILISNAENLDIEIIDIKGKILISKNNISANQAIETSILENGIYFIKLYNDTTYKIQKIVISR